MAMENTLFIGYFPIETPISSGFPIATDYRRVTPVSVDSLLVNMPTLQVESQDISRS
jgi:hypothetical protein